MEYIWQSQKRNARFVEMNSTEQQKQKCAGIHAESESTGISVNQSKVSIGSVWNSNNCGEFIVTDILSSRKIKVQFTSTGTERIVRKEHIQKGSVRDNMHPTVYGVGYVGYGDYKTGTSRKHTSSYQCWVSMIYRCYSEKSLEKSPTYKDCAVCDEWHNFQNFAKWYEDNHPNDGEIWHLDKDYKAIGNKIYSPEFCIFVPILVNSFITDREAARGSCRIGVHYSKKRKGFIAQCRDPLKRFGTEIGSFSDELSAHLAWRKRKSQYCDDLINHYDSEIIKDALRNYKRALDSNLIHKY